MTVSGMGLASSTMICLVTLVYGGTMRGAFLVVLWLTTFQVATVLFALTMEAKDGFWGVGGGFRLGA